MKVKLNFEEEKFFQMTPFLTRYVLGVSYCFGGAASQTSKEGKDASQSVTKISDSRHQRVTPQG
jgi:hypothetical protein